MEGLLGGAGQKRAEVEALAWRRLRRREASHWLAPAGGLYFFSGFHSIQQRGELCLGLGHVQAAHTAAAGWLDVHVRSGVGC